MKKLLFSVCAAIAVWGCGSGDVGGLPCLSCEENGGDGGDGGYTGSYGSLQYGGQTYKTVKIGSQTWLAENLNYNAPGSNCYGYSDFYCDVYGRLYDWATAMSLSPSCDESTCSDQIQPKHRGICPEGWHIPSDADWDILISYAGGYSAAGRYLGSSEWGGNDQHGFSALPGGGGSGGGFYNIELHGYWWTASEINGNLAYYRLMLYSGDGEYWNYYDKSNLFSVRCLKN